MTLYHTNSRGPDEAAVTRAVSQAVALAQQAGHNICCIAVHTKNSFRTGVFYNIYGDDFVRAAASGSGAFLQGCQFLLTTEKIEPTVPTDSPVIASHISLAWLEALIAGRGQASVIYLPWRPEELQAYLAAYSDSQQV
ncbi:MAG: hypothetical protein ACYC3I_21600 [Gemmataceae bacterium]